VPPAEFEIKRHWVYELLSLQRGGKTLVDSLEAGDKRRLAFAAAVLHEPEVLLLDGPTTTVDPLMRHVLWDVLEGFAAARRRRSVGYAIPDRSREMRPRRLSLGRKITRGWSAG
jgi:ABC-type multidrug transport system ATPase subunit